MRTRKTGRPRSVRAILGALAAVILLAAAAPAAEACGGTERYRGKTPRAGEHRALAIGDSVMLGAVTQLTRRGFEVDVAGCRLFSQGLSVLRARGRSLPGVVVIALGTNWTVKLSQVRSALMILGRERVLGLVTPREADGGRSSDQVAMRAAGERWPRRVKVLDWVRYSSGHANWFWSDGMHLQPRGARALTRLLGPALKWPPPDYDEPAPASGGAEADSGEPPAVLDQRAPTPDAPAAEAVVLGGSSAEARASDARPPGPALAWGASLLVLAAIGLAAALNAGSARDAASG